MTTAQRRTQPSGIVVGSMVAITFGVVFVLVNSAGLPGAWPLVIRAAGLVVAVMLLVGLVLVVRQAPPAAFVPAPGYMNRRYWLILALEAVALFGGLAVINNVLHRTAVSVAWVALVVGVHFFGLAWIWRMPLYHWLGAAMTLLGLAGFLCLRARRHRRDRRAGSRGRLGRGALCRSRRGSARRPARPGSCRHLIPRGAERFLLARRWYQP